MSMKHFQLPLILLLPMVSLFLTRESLGQDPRELARQQLYLADMQAAGSAWREGNIAVMESLLNRQMPTASESDVRQVEWYLLSGLLKRARPLRRIELPDHLKTAAFAPNSNELAVVLGSDHSVQIVDAATGELGNHFEKGPGSRWRKEFIAFSPDGKLLAYQGRRDSIVRLRNLETGQARDLPRSDGTVYAARFSPRGDSFATGNSQGLVQLWDTETLRGTVLQRLGAAINELAYSPDGKQLAVACRELSHFGQPLSDGESHQTVSVIRLSDGQVAREVEHEGAVNAIAYSPDGRFLATGGVDGVLQVHDFQKKTTFAVWRAELSEREGAVGGRIRSVAFSRDGKWLAAGGIGLRVWDTSGFRLRTTLGGHISPIQAVRFSSNDLLASVGLDHTVLVWDLNDAAWMGAEVHDFGDKVDTVAICPNGEIAVYVLGSPRLALWDPVSDQVRYIENAGQFAVSQVGLLATVSGNKIYLINMATGEKAETEITSNVTELAFSPKGDMLALATFRGEFELWSAESGQRVLQSSAQKGRVSDLVFSPDGNYVALAHQSPHHVTIWNVADTKKELTLEVGSGAGELSVAFSPDSRHLAVGRQFLGIQVWDLNDRAKPPTVLPVVTMAVSFAPDGQTLFSGQMGHSSLHAWDLTTRRRKCSLPGVPRPRDIVVSHDGRMVVVGGWNGIVRVLWATPEQ